jgi:hypothetical protein
MELRDMVINIDENYTRGSMYLHQALFVVLRPLLLLFSVYMHFLFQKALKNLDDQIETNKNWLLSINTYCLSFF